MNLSNVKKALLVSGFVLLLIAMWANINLYTSLASTPVDKATWAIMGFVFDVVKVAMLLIAGVLWTIFHRPFSAVLAFIAWLVLTGLSLSTLFGYTSKVTAESEQKAAVEGMDYKLAQGQLEATNKRLEGLASYASLDASAVQTQLDNLLAQKAQIESDLAACPKNYITNCIKPNKTRLAQVSEQIAPIQAQANGLREYQGLNTLKSQSLNASKTALAGGASLESLHPMFQNGSILFHDVFNTDVSGYQLKVWFLALSAVLCELLASFTLFIVAAIGGQNFHSVQATSKTMSNLGNDVEAMPKQRNASNAIRDEKETVAKKA